MPREIVTVQLGHYANHVGTHLWNLQDASFDYSPDAEAPSVVHDVLYRTGEDGQGRPTYTPRLLAVDLKGALGALAEEGALYSTPGRNATPAWEGEMQVVQQPKIGQSRFTRHMEELATDATSPTTTTTTDATAAPASASTADTRAAEAEYPTDTEVGVWSDYARGHLHPRSLLISREYAHKSPDLPFNAYPFGEQLSSSDRFFEEFDQRLHFFLEECDHAQGLQLLADTSDGFGGLAAGLMARVQDDYGKLCTLTWALHRPSASDKRVARQRAVANSTLALGGLTAHTSMVVPLSVCQTWEERVLRDSPRGLNLDPPSDFRTAALLAGAIDSALLPTRAKAEPLGVDELCTLLARTSTCGPFACLAARLPVLQGGDSGYLSSVLRAAEKEPAQFLHPLTPGASSAQGPSVFSLRGVPEAQLHPSQEELQKQRSMCAYDRCASGQESMLRYLAVAAQGQSHWVFESAHAMTLAPPFPDVVGSRDCAISGLTRLYTGSGLEASLSELEAAFGRVRWKHLPEFASSGFAADEISEVHESMFAALHQSDGL